MSLPRLCIVFTVVLAAAACAPRDPALAGAPAYAPANAAPPVMGTASNDLVGPTWLWQKTTFADGRTVAAKVPERYSVAFEAGGRLLLRADCNRGSARYEINGTAMRVGPAITTKVGCPADTQGGEFLIQLGRAASYGIAGGELVLTLADGATMRLVRTP